MIIVLIFILWCVAIAHFAMKQEREADAEIMEAKIDQARIDGYEMGKMVPEFCKIPIIKFDRDVHIEFIEAKTRIYEDNPEKMNRLFRELSRHIADEIIERKCFVIKESENYFDRSLRTTDYKMTVAIINDEDIINSKRR